MFQGPPSDEKPQAQPPPKKKKAAARNPYAKKSLAGLFPLPFQANIILFLRIDSNNL